MKSRALPMNFDPKQALHSTLARPLSYVGLPPSSYSPVSMNDEETRLHGFKHETDDHIPSPGSIGSGFNPVPHDSFSGSEMTSPVSLSQDLSLISGSSTPTVAGLRPTDPFSRSQSFPTIYQAQPRSTNPQLHTPTTKRRADSLASPLGSSTSVIEQTWDDVSSLASETDRSSFVPQVHQRYIHASDLGSFQDKFHHPSVPNAYSPNKNFNSPHEGHWHGLPDPNLTHMHPSRLDTSSDPSATSQHWSLTDQQNVPQVPPQDSLQNSSPLSLDDFELLQQSRMLYQTQPFNPASYVELRPQVPHFYQTSTAQATMAEAPCSLYLSDQASNSPNQFSNTTS